MAPFAALCLHSRGSSQGQGHCAGGILGAREKGSWTAGPQHPAGPALPGCDGAPWAAFLEQGLGPAEGFREGGSPGEQPLGALSEQDHIFRSTEGSWGCAGFLQLHWLGVGCPAITQPERGGCSCPTSALDPFLFGSCVPEAGRGQVGWERWSGAPGTCGKV